MKISFVSVIYNHPIDMVVRMVSSLYNTIQATPYFTPEVLLYFGDGRSDVKIENTISYHGDNLGYCGGNNYLVDCSTGEYVIIVNPDIVFKNGLCFDWLIGTAKLYDCICGKLVGKGHYTYASSFPTDKKYSPHELPFFYNDDVLTKPGNWKPMKYIDGSLMCCSRRIYDSVGGFDANIFPGYFGENAFCFNAYLRGFDIKAAHIKGLYEHIGDGSTESNDDKIKWAKSAREYFYSYHALPNWDEFIKYLNS